MFLFIHYKNSFIENERETAGEELYIEVCKK